MKALKIVIAGMMFWVAFGALAEEGFKPFVLAEQVGGDFDAVAQQVESKLEGAGFEIVGRYELADDARVLAVSRADLREIAARTPRGAYGAVLRISLVRDAQGLIQVSYVNPAYFARLYHMDSDYEALAAELASLLGATEAFGAEEGLSAEALRDYRYAIGMEQFDDPYELSTYKSHAEAVARVAAGLQAGQGGVREIYRIDIPGRKQVLFGVSMRPEKEKYADDLYQLARVDVDTYKRLAYVPYEILVDGKRVEALHMRFRMAAHFPDMSMLGEHSFMKLRRSPEAIRSTLQALLGIEEKPAMAGGFLSAYE